ncbi:hypothetical protein C6V06_28485, partial [Burkholderia gladioli]
ASLVGGPGAGVVAQGFGVPGAFVAAALAALVSLGLLCVDWLRRGGMRESDISPLLSSSTL